MILKKFIKINLILQKFNMIEDIDFNEICEEFQARVGGIDPLGRRDHVLQPYPLEKLPEEVFTIEKVRQYLLPSNG